MVHFHCRNIKTKQHNGASEVKYQKYEEGSASHNLRYPVQILECTSSGHFPVSRWGGGGRWRWILSNVLGIDNEWFILGFLRASLQASWGDVTLAYLDWDRAALLYPYVGPGNTGFSPPWPFTISLPLWGWCIFERSNACLLLLTFSVQIAYWPGLWDWDTV